MLGAIEHIKAELATVKGAPIAVVIFMALGFAGGMFWRGQEVANLETLVRIKDGEKSDLIKRLDEFQRINSDRLDGIERRLNGRQVSIIEDELSRAPSSVTVESKGDRLSPGFEQVVDTFKKSGWIINEAAGPTDLDEGKLRIITTTAEDAKTLQRAFEESDVPFSTDGVGGFVLPAIGGATD